MHRPVDRHSSCPLLPALDGGHIVVEVSRNFLSRIQPFLGRFDGWRQARERFTHELLLLVRNDSEPASTILTPFPANGNRLHFTASSPRRVSLF
jgi:hypothetical protein